MIDESKFSLNGCHRVAGIDEIASDIQENGQWVNAVNERGETPLHIAARRKKFRLIKIMLPHFDNIEASDKEGNTAMHALFDNSIANPSKCNEECSDIIETLISKRGNINQKNRDGWTPVLLAARNCQTGALNVLEKHKPDLTLRTKNGETALHLACKNMANLINTSTEMEIVNNLILHGCDMNAKDNEGYSVLHHAVNHCDIKVVEKLIDCGADLNCQTEILKLTPLHLATQKKNLIVMEILIKAGANVNSAALNGLTPLHLAIVIDSLDIAKYLIENGADVNYCHHWSPLHLAIYLRRKHLFQLLMREKTNVNITGFDCLTPLHVATMMGLFKFAKALIDRDANVNIRDVNQYTPLHAAIKDYRYPDIHHLVRCSFDAYLKDSNFSKHIAPFLNSRSTFLIRNLLVHFRDKKRICRVLLQNGADVNAVTKNNESPLYFAAENGRVKLVRMLLKLGAEMNVKEKRDGYTPLHAATHRDHVDVVRELIRANARLEIAANDGMYPLHLAASNNRVRVLKQLININVNVNVPTKDGSTALHLATLCNHVDVIRELLTGNADVNIRNMDDKSPLHLASEKSNSKILKMLIRSGAGVSNDDKKLRNTPLHIAAKENDVPMIKFLVKNGAKVNAVNENCFTPLHCAVSNGNVDAARMLIGLYANVNCKTKGYELTPLHLALQYYSGRPRLVEMLIKANADVRAETTGGVTSLHLAVLNDLSGYPTTESLAIIKSLISRGVDVNCTDRILGFTPLHIVVHNGNWDIFYLLIQSGASVNISDKNGLTPLHLATLMGNFDFVKALLDCGAVVNCRDVNMYTPLHLAIRSKRVTRNMAIKLYSICSSSWISKSIAKQREFVDEYREDLVELLIERGVNLNSVTQDGESLLHFAVTANAAAFIQMLMERGFLVNFEEKRLGLTALQAAVQQDHKETVQLLISGGADVTALTRRGRNLLHLAAQSGGIRVLKYLLRHDPNSKVAANKCPFMLSIDTRSELHVKFDVNSKDHLGMTPLHVAAIFSNERQAAITLLVHGASANVQDNSGYLPIHYAIKNNRYEQLEIFLAFGVDINDFKVYSKLEYRQIGYHSKAELCMLEHVMKLKTLEFPVARVYESMLREFGKYLEDSFYHKCLQEVQNMKDYYVGQGVSLYDVLHAKRRRKCIYVNNLEPQTIREKFPIYYSLILNLYHETIVRKFLIEKAELALHQLINAKLPIVCTDKIFHYLGSVSLMTLIKAAEISCTSSKKNLCFSK